MILNSQAGLIVFCLLPYSKEDDNLQLGRFKMCFCVVSYSQTLLPFVAVTTSVFISISCLSVFFISKLHSKSCWKGLCFLPHSGSSVCLTHRVLVLLIESEYSYRGLRAKSEGQMEQVFTYYQC